MQASLARWAMLTFCTLGAVGCQGAKTGWWPGAKKGPMYSNASSTPPQIPQQYSQQPQQAAPHQAPGYMDAAGYNQPGAQGAAGGYSTAGAYPVGGGNPQDMYPMTGAAGTTGAPGYDQAYTQQQQPGAYPDQISQAGMGAAGGGYAGAPNPYGQVPGYQPGASPYAGSPGGGYDPARTADARGTGAYGTNSPYDAGAYNGAAAGQDPNSQPGAGYQGGYQQPPAQTEQPYTPGATGYTPGNTGYTPPGTTPYQSPAGPYATDPNATSQADPHYRPGSTGDYPAGSAATAAAGGGYAASPAAGGAAAAASRYPQTGASAATDAYPTQPQVDRYGRPVQEAAGGYGGTMQR